MHNSPSEQINYLYSLAKRDKHPDACKVRVDVYNGHQVVGIGGCGVDDPLINSSGNIVLDVSKDDMINIAFVDFFSCSQISFGDVIATKFYNNNGIWLIKYPA